MTNEEAKGILFDMLGDSILIEPTKQNEAIIMAIKALEQQPRDCKTCIHSDKGNCAYTEECHECMWESKYEQQPSEDVLDKIRAEILDEAEYAYADFDRYKEDMLHAEPDELPDDDFRYGLERAVEIIDRYKESDKESKE